MPINSNNVIRANRKYEGQTCSICRKGILLGDLIHICPNCQSVYHEDCWKNEGGCVTFSCNSLSSSRQPNNFSNNYQSNSSSNYNNMEMNGFQSSNMATSPNRGPNIRQSNSFGNNRNMNANMGGGMGSGMGGNMPTNMVPCRFCKEPIMRGARKCKHCGEYQNEADRTKAHQEEEFGDATLSTTDWIGVICCPLIGLIQGAVYCGQGQRGRGLKLIKYCAIAMVINFILSFLKTLSTSR